MTVYSVYNDGCTFEFNSLEDLNNFFSEHPTSLFLLEEVSADNEDIVLTFCEASNII